jgi:hypothetical protein
MRQKYLLFNSTTTEKQVIGDLALAEIAKANPSPPAIRLMDVGAGDGTVFARMLRGLHQRYPSAPFYAVAKEISVENVRLLLEKMADRFQEHPSTVLVVTNLSTSEALNLKSHRPTTAERTVWHEVALSGSTAGDFDEQIAELAPFLQRHWQTRISSQSGSPLYNTPVVLTIYRRDHRFALDPIIPQLGTARADFDFVLLSQPWRARSTLAFKVDRMLVPLLRGLRANGRLLGVQSFGEDAGMELIRKVWPDDAPFSHGRNILLDCTRDALGKQASDFRFERKPDKEAVFRYVMRTLPGEIDPGAPMGVSTILSAWNAATYAAQVSDDRLASASQEELYAQATRDVLLRHGGLWFNDEVFTIVKRSTLA